MVVVRLKRRVPFGRDGSTRGGARTVPEPVGRRSGVPHGRQRRKRRRAHGPGRGDQDGIHSDLLCPCRDAAHSREGPSAVEAGVRGQVDLLPERGRGGGAKVPEPGRSGAAAVWEGSGPPHRRANLWRDLLPAWDDAVGGDRGVPSEQGRGGRDPAGRRPQDAPERPVARCPVLPSARGGAWRADCQDVRRHAQVDFVGRHQGPRAPHAAVAPRRGASQPHTPCSSANLPPCLVRAAGTRGLLFSRGEARTRRAWRREWRRAWRSPACGSGRRERPY